jgi:chemotaxis protein MotB
MAKKKAEAEKENSERWLLTYSDMITLLMLFFIVLYSMSNIDAEKYKQVSQAMQSIFSGGNFGIFTPSGMYPQTGTSDFSGHSPSGSDSPYSGKGVSQTGLLKRVNELFKPEMKAKYISTRIDERGLVITLSGDFFFEKGSAKIDREMRDSLDKVAKLIDQVPHFVRIEGHTDNAILPPAKEGLGYTGNWELSAARSMKVLKYFIENDNVDPRKLSSVAFGEYRPIDDNNTPEGRSANRRVDVVILKDRMIPAQDDKRIERPLPDEEWQ